MNSRLYRLLAALLIAALPVQGLAGASMGACARDAAGAVATASEGRDMQRSGDSPCHEHSTVSDRASGQQSYACLGGGMGCHDCSQCHACSASVLPTATQTVLAFLQSQLDFPSPVTFAGFIPEHLDPPPLG